MITTKPPTAHRTLARTVGGIRLVPAISAPTAPADIPSAGFVASALAPGTPSPRAPSTNTAAPTVLTRWVPSTTSAARRPPIRRSR